MAETRGLLGGSLLAVYSLEQLTWVAQTYEHGKCFKVARHRDLAISV